MSDQTSIPFAGLDLKNAAAHAPEGACRVLDGVVGPEGENGWVPAHEADAPGVPDLQSLARQPQEQSSRILAIRSGSPDELVAIDPDTYNVTTLRALTGSDDTRAVQSATVSQDTIAAVTSGSGVGSPEQLLIVRGDDVTDLPWPKPPTFSVQWKKRSGDDYAPAGTYVFRLAWRLEDGTLGPASGPLLTTTPIAEGDATYEAELEITGYPDGQPSGGWADRVEGLTVIVHPEAAVTSATDVSAPDVPGFRVSGWDGVPAVGDTTTWSDSLEGIISAESHDTRTLVHHNVNAGAVYAFNGRLLMGDVAYDYEDPLLKQMVAGADGGTDYHLTMRVAIETNQGTIVRYADPLGFSASAARSAEIRQGLLFYRDSRARSWAWLVSEDYTGDMSAATWRRVEVQGTASELSAAGNANFAYVEPDRSSVDLATLSIATTDVTNDTAWTDPRSSSVSADAFSDPNPEDDPNDVNNNATLDVQTNVLGTDEELSLARFDLTARVSLITKGGGYGSGSATVVVSIEDGSGNTLDSETVNVREDGEFNIEQPTVQLNDFPVGDAEILRVETTATAQATANGGSAQVDSTAEVTLVEVDVSDSSTSGDTVPVDRDAANAKRDRDSTRLVWSEPQRPLDLPVENVVYVGENEDDPIMALTSNAAPVSEGQYGDYPILALGRRSIWSLQVGGDGAFVQGVSPIAPDMGIVSRKAWANANGPVLAVTDRGVVPLTPEVGETLSSQLHDGTFLPEMGADTTVGFFSDEGRREVWVRHQDRTFVYSFPQGAWSTLPADRADWTRLDGSLYGVTPAGELQIEGAASSTYDVVIETAPSFLGAPSVLKRLRDLWLVQGTPPPKENKQYLHVRSIADTAVGLDYTTDVSITMRMGRGVVVAMSVWLMADAQPGATFSGVGVRYDLRDGNTPRSPVNDEGKILGRDAAPSIIGGAKAVPSFLGDGGMDVAYELRDPSTYTIDDDLGW